MPPKYVQEKPSTSAGLPSRFDEVLFSRHYHRNPAIRYSSDSIEEMSQEEIVPCINELQEKGEPFEKIISFYIGRRKLTENQTKRWLAKFNEFREEKSLSCLPGEVETCSSEVRNLRFPRKTVESFYSRLSSLSIWNIESTSGSKLPSRCEEQDETSSDSNCEEDLRKTGESAKRVRKGSWKEYKNTKDINTYLTQDTQHPGIRKLIKMTVKEIYKQKKSKNIKRDEQQVIEVDKIEVADMIYEVTEHMTKRYLPIIKDLATKIDPATDDRPDSECESGSYDSLDDFYPHKEDKRSKLPKYAMAVDPSVLINMGLYEILLVTLPLCSSYSDSEQLEDFIDILKEAKDAYTVPKGLTLRGTSEKRHKQSIKEKQMSKVIAFRAEVNASPSLDTLADILEIEDSKELSASYDDESDSASSKSVSAEIRQRLRKETLLAITSEDSMFTSVFEETTSNSADTDIYDIGDIEQNIQSELNVVSTEDTGGQVKRDRSPKQEEKSAKKSTKK